MEAKIEVEYVCTPRRELVVEHRIDSELPGFSVRWWIESDPAFGGAEISEAMRSVLAAVHRYAGIRGATAASLARDLLAAVPAAASVEVRGLASLLAGRALHVGACAHRDWP